MAAWVVVFTNSNSKIVRFHVPKRDLAEFLLPPRPEAPDATVSRTASGFKRAN